MGSVRSCAFVLRVGPDRLGSQTLFCHPFAEEILAHVLGGSVRPNNLLYTKNPVCKASVASFWGSGVEAGHSGHSGLSTA